MRPAVLLLLLSACGLGVRTSAPSTRERDARFGLLGGRGPAPSRAALCRDWTAALAGRDPEALSHVSYPESAPALSCFTPIDRAGPSLLVGPTPAGCAYPAGEDLPALRALADRLERGDPGGLMACALDGGGRTAALRHDARALRAVARRASRHPYAAVIVPGYGSAAQGSTSLVDWRPGDRCRPPRPGEMEALGPIVDRSLRAAEALRAGVAPVVIVSGGAVHSRLVEAFAMLWVLQCFLPVRPDEVIVEPCARHTHENLANAGRWLVAMSARAGYVVTDEGLQDDYLQDWSGFELVGGSIDQRALRDFGHLLGSWRQVRPELRAGFWFTPFRFWAEPRSGLGSSTCLE